MKTNKSMVVAGLIAALSVGGIGVASASTHSSTKPVSSTTSTTQPSIANVNPDAAVLAKLVTAGTITQAQSDAILAALNAAHASMNQGGPGRGPGFGGPGRGPGFGGPGRGPGFGGPMGFNLREDETVVTSTLGITASALESDLAAGKSLATIAGSKTTDLISALVAAETTEINARVTSGEITQAQATTLISGLQAAVTAAVNATPGTQGFGGPGHDHGFGDGMGVPPTTSSSAPSVTPSN